MSTDPHPQLSIQKSILSRFHEVCSLGVKFCKVLRPAVYASHVSAMPCRCGICSIRMFFHICSNQSNAADLLAVFAAVRLTRGNALNSCVRDALGG